MVITAFRPNPSQKRRLIGLAHHCHRQLASHDDRDLGAVELGGLGRKAAVSRGRAVTKIHDSFNAGGNEDWMRAGDLGKARVELGGARGERRHLMLRAARVSDKATRSTYEFLYTLYHVAVA